MNQSPSPLERIRTALDRCQSDWAMTALYRSVFDMPLPVIVEALSQQDARVPILCATALRRRLENIAGPYAAWETCARFTEVTVDTALTDPGYVEREMGLSRNTKQYDVSRQQATGVHCSYATNHFGARAGYGYLWAYRRNQYESVDLRGKIIATFAIRNTYRLALRAGWSEIVHPALILNSDIKAALISYDLVVDHGVNNVVGRQVLLTPDHEQPGRVVLSQAPAINDKRVYYSAIPTTLDEFEPILLSS